ncbi:hypothetical protein GE21DRAFT_705 [Neurospora crassa]|nr:hypothetical protein GE21DRAFT_705 [Neurospora crassa]
MCIQEYIAYQCGHRTPGVVRPCPLTTAGHNFPICTIQPSKQHLAQTMCGPCERLLHSRWVLIREWEHRWLHERGVCGCDVVFPGLLTRPRVIGNVLGSEEDFTEGARDDTIGHCGSAPTPYDTTEVEEALQQGNTGTGTYHIPPIFTETATGDQQRVAIRLPSLYAAEWLADHRALHDSGRCQCPVRFTPFQPDVGEYDMITGEREYLQEYRQTESRNRAINKGEEEITLRMAQINDTFGTFDPAAAASSPPAKPKPPLVSDLPPTGPRHTRARSHHRQSHCLHHQQEHFHQGQGHHHSQPRHATSVTLATNASVPFPQGRSCDPAAQHQQRPELFGLADQPGQLSIRSSSHAVASVYGNHEQHVYGPHTFVPMGIVFPDHCDHEPETQDGPQQLQQHCQELHSLTSSSSPPPCLPFPFPYCGLPVGSGPEGSEVHMPNWEDCQLRRCKSSFQSESEPGPGPEPRSRAGVVSSEVEAETNKVGTDTETNNGNGDGTGIANDAEGGCGAQVDHAEQYQQHRTSLGRGHQRSSSYS